jgi:hypothetical protein
VKTELDHSPLPKRTQLAGITALLRENVTVHIAKRFAQVVSVGTVVTRTIFKTQVLAGILQEIRELLHLE